MSFVRCLFASGFAAVPRGMLWGLVLALPAGCYFFCTLPYGGGLVGGPAVVIAGPFVGAFLAFQWGAAAGLYRAGHRWRVLLVPVLAATVVLLPYALYANEEAKEEEYRRLFFELQADDPAPFLAQLRVARSRRIVEDHLESFLVCAGARSGPEVLDALTALDPRGKDGDALCAVARYGRAPNLSHLLRRGFTPSRAHRSSGEACDARLEIAAGSAGSAPCALSALGDFDELGGTRTAEGCRRAAEVAALLVEAGAPSGTPARAPVRGCEDGRDGAARESGVSAP